MKSPLFSIIIPTRNRYHTLEFALKSALNQDFEDFEVVVADNSDPEYPMPESMENLLQHPKVVYRRTERILAMSENWEFAYTLASGQYLSYTGDDDGLLPYALRLAHKALTESGLPVVKSVQASFIWPDNAIFDRSYFTFPLLVIPTPKPAETIDSHSLLKRFANLGAVSYNRFPHLYNGGYVHRDILEKIKSKTGRVFESITPDVYSGYAVAAHCPEFVLTGTPLNISGRSGKSNGSAHTYRKMSDQIIQDFKSLNVQSSIPHHPQIPYNRGWFPVVYEPYFKARDLFFPNDAELKVNRKKLMEKIVGDIYVYDEEEWNDAVQKIRNSAQDDPGLLQFTEQLLSQRQKAFAEEVTRIAEPKTGFYDACLFLNGNDFNAQTVDEAALLMQKILGTEAEKNVVPTASTQTKLELKQRIRTAARVIIKGY